MIWPRIDFYDTESFSDDADEDEVAVQITDQGGRALTLPKEEKRVMTEILNHSLHRLFLSVAVSEGI